MSDLLLVKHLSIPYGTMLPAESILEMKPYDLFSLSLSCWEHLYHVTVNSGYDFEMFLE